MNIYIYIFKILKQRGIKKRKKVKGMKKWEPGNREQKKKSKKLKMKIE